MGRRGDSQLLERAAVQLHDFIATTLIGVKEYLAQSSLGISGSSPHMPMSAVFDCEGLWREWDSVEPIRAAIRGKKNLTQANKAKADSSIMECVNHLDALRPVLVRSLCANLTVPQIDHLREEIQCLYDQSQREVKDDVVDDDSWAIRRMVRFVKRKAQRGDVSCVTYLD